MGKETKVLLVICDDVNERTLREFLRLGCYQFSTAYIQQEAAETPRLDPPTEEGEE